MAVIAPKPIILTDIDLVIDADNYELSVSKCELVPTTPTAKWKGMSPAGGLNLVGTPDWVLNIDFAQDHDTAKSLSQFALTNTGLTKTVKLKPKKGTAPATAPTYTVTAVIVPGAIGGSVDSIATASVTWPVDGQPVRTVV